MSLEKTKSTDTVSCGLVTNTSPSEQLSALGYFTIQCFDKDGKLKWEDANHNLVVNTGLQYMAGVALTSTTQITTWYIGLYGAGADNAPAAGNTMGSHSSWTEVAPYAGDRPQVTFVAATLGNPSVVTNSSAVSYSINATATVGGAFLTSSNTRGGNTGTLFSAADFQIPAGAPDGNRSVASGDTLNVTYTLNLAG